MSAKPCNRCGQLVVFGQLWDKTWVALTNQVECYRVTKGMQVKKDEGTYILHRVICPAERNPTPDIKGPEQEPLDLGHNESERYPT